VQSKLVTHGTQLTTQQIMPAEWLTLSCGEDKIFRLDFRSA